MRFETLHPTFGVRVSDVDVERLDEAGFAELERRFFDAGVMAIGGQDLTPAGLSRFGSRFGTLYRNPTSPFRVPEVPEIMLLSTRRQDGKVIGQARAGEAWHTDMCYNRLPGRITMLFGEEVPMRDGQPLGDTKFADMVACYAALPEAIKEEIAGAEAVHDFNTAFDRRITYEGKPRMTEAQRALRPPVRHPMVARHPVTGRPFLYINLGFVTEIVGFAPERSRVLLDWLFAFQVRPEFLYRHKWRRGDILLWDDLSTIHQATLDYEDHEIRHMLRAQVDGDRPLIAA
jgi:taurine dioxygenase